MGYGNGTEVTDFYLLGFGGQQKFPSVLILEFLVIYVTSMVVILLINTDSRLQTPTYFLQHLAFADICYTSAVTPKMLQNFMAEDKSISFRRCVIQLLVYMTFATSCHYIVICKPLHYHFIMSQTVCILLVVGSYLMGSLNASSNINHFFCDIPPVINLLCSNMDFNFMQILGFVGFNLTFTVSVMTFSYIRILAAILRMSSAVGRKKTFSTCPPSEQSQDHMKVASIFYAIICHLCHPYSMRSKEAVKVAGKKFFKLGQNW
uniref:G-protein coupled receptors family 1 profile domain-containing protein n=1 Tax=Cavia porcellus TaxID=10141 RepID=A0A286XIW6_CAVPO